MPDISAIHAVLFDTESKVTCAHTLKPDVQSVCAEASLVYVWSIGELSCDCARSLLMQECLEDYSEWRACIPRGEANVIQLVSLRVDYIDGTSRQLLGDAAN